MMKLHEVFKLSEKEILKRLRQELVQYGYRKIQGTKKYLYAEGDIPILLVAHLDTVHKVLPKTIYWDKEQDVYWSPEGLGADDRAGVWGILTLLENGYRPHIMFTTGEEVGGIGARAAVKNMKVPLVHYAIELDRTGSMDAVFYDCDSEVFTKYVEGFGFEEHFGSFSDISVLCPAWGIAGVNLSTGYYLAHTTSEYLNMSELMSVVNKVAVMLDNPPSEPFPYVKGYTGYSRYGYGANFKDYKSLLYKDFYCDMCGSLVPMDEESVEPGFCKHCYDHIMGAI